MKTKQTKADKAFIEKIKTIQISGSKVPMPTCPDCGKPIKAFGCIVEVKRREFTLNRSGDVINEQQSFAE